jgi:WD40 repeat protein
VSSDRRTAYYGYWVTNPTSGQVGAAYLDRWSLPSGRPLPTIRIGSGRVTLRLVAGGSRLAIVDARGVTLFDAATLARRSFTPIRLPAPAAAVAVSPDARTAVIGTQTGSVFFIDLASGRVRQGVGGHAALVANIAYSPDDRVVVTTAGDGKVIAWDPTTARPIELLTGHGGSVHGAAFSADGQTLYTSSLDGVVLAWDLGTQRRFGHLFTLGPKLPDSGLLGSLEPPFALSPDGSRLAVILGTSSVGLFSTRTSKRVTSFKIRPQGTHVTALAWSPSGHELAVGGYSGLLQLWSATGSPRRLRSLTGLRWPSDAPEAIQSISFRPHDDIVAATDLTSHGAQTAQLAFWRASSGSLIRSPTRLGSNPHATTSLLAYSRDGKRLAVAVPDGRVLLLDGSSSRLLHALHPLGADSGVVSLAFAPNETLATGTWAGIVQLWNPASGHQLGHPLHVAAGPVESIAFDPTGERFATTGGGDGSAKLWFTSTLQQEGATFPGDQAAHGTATFQPDGANLLIVDDQGHGFLWPTSPTAWERHACAVAGRNLTREEWARFVTGYRYRAVCP